MIRGADAALVEAAVTASDPFPGTRGFAGQMPDGRLVRDVLGRVPLFVDGPPLDWRPPGGWGFEPTQFSNPQAVPAGTVLGADGLDRRWSLPYTDPLPEEEALAGLRNALETTFDQIETDGLAIGFSGGVDSAVLAAALDAPLYTVGFEGSTDVEVARDVADQLGRDLTVHELSVAELASAVPRVANAITSSNAMHVQIALTLSFVAEAVAADGYDRLALGQGADELFGGYAKIEAVDHRVEADTVRGARREAVMGLPEGIARDTVAIRAAGVEPVMPYLHDRVVEAAMSLPTSLVVSDGVRKRGFRTVATDFVPQSVADRPKKAMQYGSLVARELDRLARQAGFKRRMDDHVGQYVRSRIQAVREASNGETDSP